MAEAADEIERLTQQLKAAIWTDSEYCKIVESDNERLRAANERLGNWMAAALDDPAVCAEMKADIEAWFEVWFVQKEAADE